MYSVQIVTLISGTSLRLVATLF